jgi:transcriptional regulator with XRE-family HTH domain
MAHVNKHYQPLFGEILSMYRRKRGLSQHDLQDFLDKKGYYINPTLISKYESGARVPNPEFIVMLVTLLNLSPDEQYTLLDAYWTDRKFEFYSEYTFFQDKAKKIKQKS